PNIARGCWWSRRKPHVLTPLPLKCREMRNFLPALSSIFFFFPGICRDVPTYATPPDEPANQTPAGRSGWVPIHVKPNNRNILKQMRGGGDLHCSGHKAVKQST
ncbi:unnamed protein product, partial [Dovyalis caffra]